MREVTLNKLHIFIVMFFMSLIMSIQSPIFTPYAASLGASAVFIGIMMSAAQFANLSGNLIAGPLVDRFGRRIFITVPLFLSGLLLIGHGLISNSLHLLVLRMMNGFSLAFLAPAAMALLSGYAANSQQQGKNMAINGMLGMIASIIAPLIGGNLGAIIGYANSYFLIGSALILIAVYTGLFLKDGQVNVVKKQNAAPISLASVLAIPKLHIVFLTAFALMYIHGVIIYEVPYLTVEEGLSTVTTGQLFSFMAVGTLFSLSLFFIHRFDPVNRMIVGLFGMCISVFAILTEVIALPLLLFLVGFFFGIIMPAMATAITDGVSREGHGRAFGVMSAVTSLGMIFSSFITGVIREVISPYFIAFLVGMIVLTVIGYLKLIPTRSAQPKVY